MDRVGNIFNRLIIFNSRLNHRSSGRGAFGNEQHDSHTHTHTRARARAHTRAHTHPGAFGNEQHDSRLVMILFFNTEDKRGSENSILWHDPVI